MSNEKNQAMEKALLVSLVDESKKASPNEDESDEGSSPNNSPYETILRIRISQNQMLIRMVPIKKIQIQVTPLLIRGLRKK